MPESQGKSTVQRFGSGLGSARRLLRLYYTGDVKNMKKVMKTIDSFASFAVPYQELGSKS
jgi:hypothetical protein